MKIFAKCDGCPLTAALNTYGGVAIGGKPSGWWSIDIKSGTGAKASIVLCPDCAVGKTTLEIVEMVAPKQPIIPLDAL